MKRLAVLLLLAIGQIAGPAPALADDVAKCDLTVGKAIVDAKQSDSGRLDTYQAAKAREIVDLLLTFKDMDPKTLPSVATVLAVVELAGAGVMVFNAAGCAELGLVMPVEQYEGFKRVLDRGWHK